MSCHQRNPWDEPLGRYERTAEQLELDYANIKGQHRTADVLLKALQRAIAAGRIVVIRPSPAPEV